MGLDTLRYWYSCREFTKGMADYKPQPVTSASITKWINQFDSRDRKALLSLLKRVKYLSEKEVERTLVGLNQRLLSRLQEDGIPPKRVIYMQMHAAASSSAVMLNMLRDRGRLEQRGCIFLDHKDVRGLLHHTQRLGQGAIIYVDDFAATGHQFLEVRDFIAEYIIGSFSEFFLLPCICEEAYQVALDKGVEPVVGSIHSKAERPLHPDSPILDARTKARLVELCQQIDRRGPLGYRDLATMVVLYRNAPNTVPVVLRGSPKQTPWVGILPRTTDLPYQHAVD